MRRQGIRYQTYIFRLPSELLLKIISLVWNSALTEADKIMLMTRLSLVSKHFAAVFDGVWQSDVKITSEEFYNYYMRRINNLDRSHPMNTRCRTLRFDVDATGKEERAFPYAKLPLFMQFQEDFLGYFNNGKEFHLKGLLPNLSTLFIRIHNSWIRDPYQALFPHCMPRTVQNIHISYTFSKVVGGDYKRASIERICRQTPIRYPSIPHKLRTLTVTGLRGKMNIARLWVDLFEVEEFIVDGQVLPVDEDKPWGLDMNQALNMLESGSKGVGWRWSRNRPKDRNSLNEIIMNQDTAVLVDETVGSQVPLTRPRLMRCLTIGAVGRTSMPRIKRSKTISVLPVIDYPYGMRVNVDGRILVLYT
ncbi:hypothetical protein Clacol_005741 [Clathrus columnatus]|uniref:F-box domain-containing protein n=1 Tax=Clathrus columnatus TaxID=1419009 RepID=A0AAV5ADE7_9AGAM|nr:hypothetical protein Clacol_005741 [Clathrus columnatus]